MPITSKDAVGLALAACTVVLLIVHGRQPHDSGVPNAVEVGREAFGLTAAAQGVDSSTPPTPTPSVVAFVDVQLPGVDAEVSAEHVVLVRHGVVAEIGSTRSVDLPADAFVVDGDGSSYLVAIPGKRESAADWHPVAAGSRGELVLYASDPRRGSGVGAIRGRLVAGRWTPSAVTKPPQPPAGH